MFYVKPRSGEVVEYHKQREADKLGIQYIPWRDATAAGQWVVSDDAIVVKTRYVRYITEKQGNYYRTRRKIATPLSIRFPHGRRPMNLIEHMDTKSYGYRPEPWWEKFNRDFPAIKSMLTKAVAAGLLRMSENRRYNRREYQEFIRIAKQIFDRKDMSWYHVRTYFGREEVRDEIRTELARVAHERGYKIEKVFDLLDEAEKFAKEKKDSRSMISLAKEVASIVRQTSPMKLPDRQPPDDELPGTEDHLDRILEGRPQAVTEESTSADSD